MTLPLQNRHVAIEVFFICTKQCGGLRTLRVINGLQCIMNSPAQNQFDLELWYKVFFFTDSCRLHIAIKDSG